MIILVLWVILSFIIASFGSGRNIGFGGALICCLLFSPLIGALSDRKTNKTSSTKKYIDAIEEAKMLEFKGKKAEALDKYLDGYYLYQTALRNKQIFINEQSIRKDEEFRNKIVELGGKIPADTLDPKELHKEYTKLRKDRIESSNRNLLILLLIAAGLIIAFLVKNKL